MLAEKQRVVQERKEKVTSSLLDFLKNDEVPIGVGEAC
jgi:hypothetical protein